MKAKKRSVPEKEVFYESDEALDDDDDDFDDYDDEDEEEVEEGASNRKRKRSSSRNGPGAVSKFLDMEAEVNDDDDEEDEAREEDYEFLNDSGGADLNPNDEEGRRVHRPPLPVDDDEDLEDYERRMKERFSNIHREIDDDDEGGYEIDQQALLPCVRDPKLWKVKCAIGHERELALCLMQKCIDRLPDNQLQILSAIARDDLKNYIYVEAHRESHVREACKGLRNVISQNITMVPVKEMTDVVSVKKKAIDIVRDSWVRMKVGDYAGDIAKIVDVDDVRQRVTVKLVPRIDLQAIAQKLDGLVSKKKGIRVPARLMNMAEAKGLGIQVEHRRDRETGEYFDRIGDKLFRDGFLYKKVSRKSIRWEDINPSFDELEKFRGDDENNVYDGANAVSKRKKGKFVKGDAVVVMKGDLKKLVGRVEKVEEESVDIRPEMKELPETIVINRKELCKFFKLGDHVKVAFGGQAGAIGMVVKFDEEKELVTIWSDKMKQHVCVFADDVVGCFGNSDGGNGGYNPSRLDNRHSRTTTRRFSCGGRGHDPNGLAGTGVKIRQGPYKGYRGRVVEVKGSNLRVELQSRMKIVTVDRGSCISDSDELPAVATPLRRGNETPMRPSYMSTPMRDPRATPSRYGNETPMHPWSTPRHASMSTPMRDPGATPVHDGFRNPLLH